MRRAAWLVLAVAAALAGCGGDALECANPEPGVVEVGVGDLDTGFTPVGDGDDVLVVLGPQGLHMVVVSARVQGFEMPAAGEMCQVAAGIRSHGELVGGTVGRMDPELVVEQPGTALFLGLRAAFTIEDVRPLEGTEAQLEVVVTDGCGRELEGSRTVTLTL